MPDNKKLQFNKVEMKQGFGEKTELEKSKNEQGLAEKKYERGEENGAEQILESFLELKEDKTSLEQKGIVSIGNNKALQIKRQKEIEEVLEDGLSDNFIKMEYGEQQKFKRLGEKTAQEINNLLNKAKVKIKKIIELIKKWLSFIPGMNNFFIEQEAKIKADRIIKIKI